MDKKYLYLSRQDVHHILYKNYQMIMDAVQDALTMAERGTTRQPDKISQIFDERFQNRINCMPSTLNEIQTCGMKWVSVFPSNQEKGLDNVEGFSLLSDTVTGGLKCFMNATECTSFRTAAVGAIAAKYLARSNSASIGFIGAGEEAKAHLQMIKFVCPEIRSCYISSRTEKRTKEFVEEFKNEYPDIRFIDCRNNYESAVINADIIVTAISSQAQVLKAEWMKKGMCYIHVAGLEDEFEVAKKADKIICDSWEAVKHRSQTIAQMYQLGLLKEQDIYGDIGEIILGKKNGRENSEEFIYFNSVGLSAIDVLLCNRIYEKAKRLGIGTWVEK